MSNALPPPPARPGLGSTFKRPIDVLTIGGPPDTAGLIITDQVPPELVTFYTTAPHGALSVAKAAILLFPEANIYFYIVVGTTPAGDFLGLGSVVGASPGGTVTEALYIENDPGLGIFFDFSPLTAQFGSFGPTTVNYVLGTLLNYNNVSMPLAPLLFVRVTSNVAQLANVNEQFLFDTVTAFKFRNGRAYKVTIVGQVNSTALQHVRFRVRKNVLAGINLIQWPTINIDAVSTDIPVYLEGIIVNTSGADVTTKLAVTTQGTAATVINFDGQAAPTQTYIKCEDVGDTNMYSGVSM